MNNTNNKIDQSAGERIRYIRKLLSLTQKKIEEEYKIPVITLTKIESGKSNISEKMLTKLISLFESNGIKVTSDWIKYNIGPSPEIEYYRKKFREIKDDIPSSSFDDSLAIEYEADEFMKKYENSLVIRVMTNEMLPKFKSGDFVGGKQRDIKLIDSLLGRDCIVQFNNIEGYSVKRLTKDFYGRYNLSILNIDSTETMPVIFDVKIQKIYNIVWHRWVDN